MKRWISLLLVLTMMLSLCGGIGVTAFADEQDEPVESVAEEPVADETAEEDSTEETVAEEPVTEELGEEAVEAVAEETADASEQVDESEQPADVEESEQAAESDEAEDGAVTEEEPSEEAPVEEAEEALAEDGAVEEEVDDSEKYVVTKTVSYGDAYVIAYQADDGIYYVLENVDGDVVVREMEKLTINSVEKSMLWTVKSTEGADAIVGAEGDYLYIDDDGAAVTSEYDYGWFYAGAYLEYTSWNDHIYTLTVDGHTVLFYAPEREAVTAKNSLRASGSDTLTDGVDGSIYLAFGSDRHGGTSAIKTAMSGMPKTVSYVGLIGDMVSSGNENTNITYNEVISFFGDTYLNAKNVDIVYGSHDASMVDGAGIMNGKTASGLIYTGKDSNGNVLYYVYGIAFRDINKDDSNYSNSGAEAAANAFITWVNNEYGSDNSIPIIVLSHTPIHAKRGDNYGGEYWNKALNYAATGEKTTESGKTIIRNVVFLHGHNHTKETTLYNYQPGTNNVQIQGPSTTSSSTVYYSYLTAGYMNSEVSGRPTAHSTLMEITSNELKFYQFPASSGVSGATVLQTVTRIAATTPTDGTLTSIEITTPPTKTEYTTDDMELDLNGLVVTANYQGADSRTVTGYTVSTVDFSTAGTKTVTVSYTEGEVTKTATFDVTVTKASGGDDEPTGTTTVYVLTTNLEAGKEYLIVNSKTAGNTGYLLAYDSSGTNNVGSTSAMINAPAGNIADVYIKASDVTDVSKWTVSIGTTSTSDYVFTNIGMEGYTFYRASGKLYIVNSAPSSGNNKSNEWTLGNTDGETYLAYKGNGSNSIDRYVIYSNGWTVQQNTVGNVYFYEKTETSSTTTSYTITYDLDGGSVDGTNPTSYTAESEPITLINPTKTGYTFAGWTGTGLDAATATVTIPTGSTGNRAYTATWTRNSSGSSDKIYVLTDTLTAGKNYLIVSTNAADDGSALGHTTTTVEGKSVTVKDAATSQWENVTANYIDSVDASAIWTAGSGYTFKNGDYYLAFSYKQSSGSRTYTLNCSTDSQAWTASNNNTNLYYNNAGSSTNYYFVSYVSSAWTMSKVSNSTTSDTYKIYLYEEVEVTPAGDTYTLSYDANGGTGTMDDQTGKSTYSVSSNGFTFGGYEFDKWNTAVDGSGTGYAAGDTITLTGDTTLYAQWKQASSSGGSTTEEKTVYVLTDTLSTGDYLIVNVNSAGSGFALGHNGTTLVNDAGVTVKAGQSYTDNKPFIEEVAATSVWSVSSGYYFTNIQDSSTYYLTIGQGTLAAKTSQPNGNFKSYSNNALAYSGGSTYYLQYNDSKFSASKTESTIYLYKKTTVTVPVTTTTVDWTWTPDDYGNYATATATFKTGEGNDIKIAKMEDGTDGTITVELEKETDSDVLSALGMTGQTVAKAYPVYRDFTYNGVTKNKEYKANRVTYTATVTYNGETYTSKKVVADKLFGGWYKDAKHETYFEADPGNEVKYAKLVDPMLLNVAIQITNPTYSDAENTNMRVISSVDSLKYRQVGFVRTYTQDGTTKLKLSTTTKVYSELTGFTGIETKSYFPGETFGTKEASDFFAFIYTVPNKIFQTELHFVPFWKTYDGTMVYGYNGSYTIANSQYYVDAGTGE